MTESELYSGHLKPLFIRMGLFYKRIEQPCVPDIYLFKNRTVCWIEMKCLNHKQEVIKPSWRVGQLAWIQEHNAKDGYNGCMITSERECRCYNVPGKSIFLALWCVDRIYFLPPKKEYQKEELICQKKAFLEMFNQK